MNFVANTRKSNIELLRLVCMLMIVNLHTFCFPEFESGTPSHIGVFRLLDLIRESIAIPAVNIFVLISGYFSIKLKPKKLCSLLFQCYFWLILIWGVMVGLGYATVTKNIIINRLFFFNDSYWFIREFLVLMVISPFLNLVVGNLSLVKFRNYLVAYLAIQVIYSIYATQPFGEGYTVASFIGLYLVGRYLRMSQFGSQISMKTLLWALVGLVAVETAGAVVSMVLNNSDWYYYLLQYNNPVVIIEAVVIFLIFNKFNISSPIINYCSGSALAIYLLHEHPDVEHLFLTYFRGDLYAVPVVQHIVILLLSFVAIFVVAILVDKLRLGIFNYLYPRCRKLLLKRAR